MYRFQLRVAACRPGHLHLFSVIFLKLASLLPLSPTLSKHRKNLSWVSLPVKYHPFSLLRSSFVHMVARVRFVDYSFRGVFVLSNLSVTDVHYFIVLTRWLTRNFGRSVRIELRLTADCLVKSND